MPDTLTGHPVDTDTSVPAAEPPDDNMYKVLAMLFLIGMPLVILGFVIMITVLAGAS